MAAVNNFYDEDLTNRTHTGDTNWTFVAGMAQIAGGSLLANTKYLIKARALFGGDDTGQIFGCRVSTADDAAIATKSEAVIEPANAAYYFPYYFVHSFETDGTPADVEFQIKTFDGAFEVQIDQISLELIDLDDLGGSNYFETVHADDASEYPATQATEFSIAGANLGTDEWVVWWCQRTLVAAGGVSRNYRVEAFSAVDSATSVVRQRDENEGEDPAELRMSGGALRHKASSGTPDFEIQTWEEATAANYLNAGGYAIALKRAAFAEFQWDYTAGSTTLDTTERTFATVAAYSPGTTADHLVEGSISRDVSNAQAQIHLEDDGTEMRVGDQPIQIFQSYDLTAFPLVGLFHRNNILSSDTSTYTLRARINTGSETAEFRWLIILSLELAVSAVSGAGAIAEQSDDATGAGTVLVSGSGAIAEVADIASGVGTVLVSGSGAITEQPDDATGTGTILISGAGAISEQADDATGAGNVLVSGSGAVAEQSDDATGAGSTAITGAGTITESSDNVAGAGNILISGSGAITELPDNATGVGTSGAVAVWIAAVSVVGRPRVGVISRRRIKVTHRDRVT